MQIFDVADIIEAVNRLVNNFVIAISFVGSFVLLSGILILIGSVALTKSQRIYENAILKTLGANRRTLGTILLAEYGLLGLLAGMIATGFAVSLSYVVTKYLMNIDWEFDAVMTAAGVMITAVLVTIVAWLPALMCFSANRWQPCDRNKWLSFWIEWMLFQDGPQVHLAEQCF